MAANPTTLTELRGAQTGPREAHLPSVQAGFGDLASFELAQRAAKLLASSTLVPQQYQGDIANCVVALEMAQRIGASALMVMQNLYIVHGRPAWSAQFVIAAINQCGRFSALRYEWSGTEGKDDWGCRAWAIEKGTGERLVGPLVTVGLAKKEGWESKNGSKWKTIPQLMLMYRAGAWFGRTYAPELTMGLRTTEEEHEIIDITPRGEVVRHEMTLGDAASASGKAPTIADLAPMISQATTGAALAEIRNLVPSVEDAEHREELLGMIEVRIAELTQHSDE